MRRLAQILLAAVALNACSSDPADDSGAATTTEAPVDAPADAPVLAADTPAGKAALAVASSMVEASGDGEPGPVELAAAIADAPGVVLSDAMADPPVSLAAWAGPFVFEVVHDEDGQVVCVAIAAKAAAVALGPCDGRYPAVVAPATTNAPPTARPEVG